MSQYMVLSLIGDDKPGLVDLLSETIAAHQGNWQESRMAHLADKFAGILTVAVPEEQEMALAGALLDLGKQGLHVTVEKAQTQEAQGQRWLLSLVGNDRPGIIKEVSQVLHALSINVAELTTHCEPAPMSSDLLFKADAILTAPATLSLEELEQSLERITNDLIVEVRSDDIS